MNIDKLGDSELRQLLRIGGVLLGIVFLYSSGQALAQDEASQRTSSADTMLDEIIVTTRRREERLLDQPMSIAAFTGEQLQVLGIQSIDDVSRYVPNVTLASDDRANNTRVVIRGIGGGFPDPVQVFGAGMYIDGHYIPTSMGGYMSTLDVERIELLRGPQGTLFGKNVIGGLVNIISTKPQPKFDSSIRLRLGEDGEQAIRGMVNVPFSDKVFGRFSAASEQFDGYYRNRNLGGDEGGKDSTSFRAAIRAVPNENWTIDASVAISRKEDDSLGGQCLGDPLGDAPLWGGGAGNLERRLYTGAHADFVALCAEDVAAGDFVQSSDKSEFSDVDEEMVTIGAKWDSKGEVGTLDNATFSLKGSYRKMEYTYFADRDFTSWPLDSVGTFGPEGQNNETLGFELLFEAQASDRLRFTLGANYFDEEAFNGEDICFNLFVDSGASLDPSITVDCPVVGLHFELAPNNPGGIDIDPGQDPGLWPNAPRINGGGPGPFINHVSVFNESIGLFGHLTYDLTDLWTLDLGVRWTEDDRDFNNIEYPSAGCDISVDPTGHCSITTPANIGPVGADGFFNTASDTFSKVTPLVSLTRNLTPSGSLQSGMFYFLYSAGFLTGGFNTEVNSNLPAVIPLLSYDPEEVDNFEIGFKGQFLDGKVQLMADVFLMDYTNQQQSVDLANPDGDFGADDPIGIIQNVAKSQITGVELELRASPWDGGVVSFDLAYLENEFDEYDFVDPADPTQSVDRSNVIQNDFTPEWTLNLAVQHEFQLAAGGSVTPRLHLYSQGEYEWAAETGSYPRNGPKSACHQDSYTTLDGRVSYRPANGDWELAVFGGNITDERYIDFCETDRSVWLWRLGRPRWFGVEFSANFGRD